MDQRFTIKDFFLFSALALLFVTLLSAMYMVDRQWEKMAAMQKIMDEQAKDLRSLKSSIRSLDQRLQGNAAPVSGEQVENRQESIPPAFRRAWQATQKKDYSDGDWLVQSFGVNLKSITPFISEDAYSAEIQSYVLESLLIRNPETLNWEGLVAKSWQISDNGLTITFQMRDEAKFSDGQPIEAGDVAFTFRFIMDPAIRAPRERAYYSKIESVKAVGKHQVVFQFKEPYYDALALAGSMPILPEHFYAPYLKQPNTFNQSKGLLLGSGPYRLSDPTGWTPDKGIVELERNPRYWGPVQPSFDHLLWKVIENDSARLTTFRNGEIDVYGARPREYDRLKSDPELKKKAKHFEYMSPTGGYSYIGWNQKRRDKPTRFADKRVRQAMTYLTDRDRIIDEIFLGYAEPASGPFNPRGAQHNPGLKPRPYDPEKGRELLRQAGYEDRNGDGILEDADGKPFEFELVYFQGNEDTKRMVLFLKDLYARAGILLKPKPTEWSVMLDLLKKRDFDAITLGWTGSIESDLYQIFHSSQIADGGNNNIGYSNKKLDALIERARATVDEKKRMPLWQEAEAILYEDQAYTFLVRRKTLAFIARRLHDLEKTKLGLNLGIVPVEIYVPEDEQKYGR
jgi:peptide/nickel transport system substrate-binding protein